MRHLLLLGTTLSLACNLTPDTNGKDGDDTSTPPGGTTVADVQQGEVAADEAVLLEGVVATTGLSGDGKGFFVQDAGGGPWSGIYIYLYGSFDDLQVAPGDVLDIAGTVTEYYDFTEISVTSTYDISKSGTAEVTADAVSCGESDWEQWEGGLIRIDGVEMTSPVNSYGEVETTCGVKIDNMFFDFDGGSGATCASITGALAFSYEEFKLEPRTEADLVDCTEGEPPETATIASLRQDGFVEGAQVVLEGVVATSGLTEDGKGFFVQDAGGGPHTGLYVYLQSGSFSPEPGMVLDITGEITEYYEMLEIKVTGSDITDTGADQTPVASTLSSTPADWEAYEGALVTLPNLGITATADYGEVETSAGINVDDLFFDHGLAAGTTLDSLTGAITYSYSAYKVCPRTAADIVE